MKIFKNNKKLIIGLIFLVSLFIGQIIINITMMALICEPTPYCRVSFYSRFPNFTVVFLELLPWLEIIGLIILIWALGEKIVNWIKKKKDRNK